ncbi:MAG: hypothetical protein AAB353_08775, partial [Candidatus Hydrogenedentota bacterium]
MAIVESKSPAVVAESDPIGHQLQIEHARLLREAGIAEGPGRHFKRPREAEFTREERENVTILCGGFSLRHDRFVKASCQGLGYNVE